MLEYKGCTYEIIHDHGVVNPLKNIDFLGSFVLRETYKRSLREFDGVFNSTEPFEYYGNRVRVGVFVIPISFAGYDFCICDGKEPDEIDGWYECFKSDVGKIGCVIKRKEKKCYNRKVINSVFEGMLKSFIHYLRGECFGVKIYNKEGEELSDSNVFGFYGETKAIEYAKYIIDTTKANENA